MEYFNREEVVTISKEDAEGHTTGENSLVVTVSQIIREI